MDLNALVGVLEATLDPVQQQKAEQQLNEVHKIIGFGPVLLQVVMSNELKLPTRQAGVIYLKNMVAQFWQEREVENPSDPVPFSIHEQDRAVIRENIVEAIIFAPDPIRVQLTVCISNIIKHDFPGRWAALPEKINAHLQSDNIASWLGALIVLYQLVKNYEYKKADDRNTLNPVMTVFLPIIHERCVLLRPDTSNESHLLQKQILKIFYALIQYHLPLELITKQIFTQWMEVIGHIIDVEIPDTYHADKDEEERPELPWWKCKKWALHILARSFERYGSPGNVTKEYNAFSEWYLKSFSGGIINVILKVLHRFQQKHYVTPRVLQQALNYINQAISHAFSWKYIKPHMQTIIQEVLFPLMCHSDDDDEMWNNDPHEYIRTKFDIFEDFISPVTAAQTVLHSAVAKRKEVLQKCMGFCLQMMAIDSAANPRLKDGVLHMVGAVADILLKRKIYKDQAETMLVTHVYPEFYNDHGFLRARACWVVRYFSEVQFKSEANLIKALQAVQGCLCGDKDLPVRVEAAIALQMLITEQEKAQDHMRPYVKSVILEMLKIIRETENDDLTNVLQKLVCTYVDDIPPIAVEMTQHLATTFGQIIQSEDGEQSDEKAIAAMGVLNTIDAILTVVEDHKEIIAQLEGIVLQVVVITLNQNVLEFYEEILSLIYSLTMGQISNNMWEVFAKLYEMFQKEGFDYFTDMMPALHNYITVDTPAFLSNPSHIESIYNMCKTIMTSDSGEDAECHAAKLLEVILLQCKEHVDSAIPTFLELALERLTREIRTSELRTMCLQVVIAALYYNTAMTLEILEKISLPNTTESISSQFFKQWLHDTDCFLGLHDRKISVLGLCALMDTPAGRPTAVTEHAAEIIPSCIMLFDGLKKAYESRAAEADDSDDDEEEDDGEYEGEVLDSDEDEVDEQGNQYLEKLERSANGDDDDSDAEYSDDGAEETALESYNTPLDAEDCTVDEYQIFKNVLQNLQTRDPSWYNTLIGNLTAEQQGDLKKVIELADKRKAAEESKKIEQGGGYNFTQVSVPSTFNFGS
ncbi:unnamed protein product [Owenia fusiformis]|uniref:Uncharacterized protein n=1 Tax=Owenia fusiformis TaxID=6347 RepID=A0A8J1Y274_OWEFU|nr:unnamed protein product [Owenia fusiformis]